MSTDLCKMGDILKNDIPNRHSYFQLKYFVIGKEPTAQGKMWQCLRELRSRSDALENVNLEIDETKDQKALLELDLGEQVSTDSQIENKRCEIKRRQMQRKIVALDKKLEELSRRRGNTEEEALFFVKAFESLNKVEPLKGYDDLDAQLDYWNAKLTQSISLKQIFRLPPDTELILTALALPDDALIKKETVYTINKVQEAILDHKSKAENTEAK